MGKSEKKEKIRELAYYSKKCPECMTDLSLDVTICPQCKIRVKEVDQHGKAKKPVDVKAYTLAIILWAAFFLFVWKFLY